MVMTALLSLGNTLLDEGDGYQAYLIFQPVYIYFKMVTNTNNYISSWKSKGLNHLQQLIIVLIQ